jgi:dTDP-4-amino-4,6-dideoxygalactose transaminase
MEGIQGAILRVKLRHLEAWTEQRRLHAEQYDILLSRSVVDMASVISDRRHVYHIYAVRVARRDALQQALEREGIQTGIHYPVPVHMQKAYADLGYGPGDFPVSERLASQVLSLPMFPELASSDIDRVAEVVCGTEWGRVQSG